MRALRKIPSRSFHQLHWNTTALAGFGKCSFMSHFSFTSKFINFYLWDSPWENSAGWKQGWCCGVRKLGSTKETPRLELVQGKSCQRVTHQAGDVSKVDFGCFQPWKNKLNGLRAQNLGFFSVSITKIKKNQVTLGMMIWQLAQEFCRCL